MSLNRRILKDTLIVTLVGLVAQTIGFLFSVLVAQRFGVSRETDAYYLAFAIPDLLTGIVISGAIKIVFVPVFVEERLKRPDEVPAIVGAAIAALLALSGAGMLIILALAGLGWLDYGSDPLTASATQQLTLEMLPLIPLTLFFSLFNAIYNAYQRFAMAEVAQAIKYAVVIACLLLLSGTLGIHSLVVGQIIGQTLAVIMVMRAVQRQTGLSLRPRRTMPDGFRRMLALSALPFVSVMMTQLNPFTARFITAYLSTGSASVLSYAQRLVSIPSLLVGSSFSAVLTSHWSKLSAQDQRETLRLSLNRSLSTLILILLPLVTGLIVLREPLVSLVYRRGQFDVAAAAATASVFAILALQIVPNYLHMVIVRVLLAEKAMRPLFGVSVLGLIVTFAAMLGLVLLGFEVWGVAVGMVIGTTTVMVVTALIVHHRYVEFDWGRLVQTTGQVVLATGVMVLTVVLVQRLLPIGSAWSDVLAFGAASLIGFGVYAGTIRLLGHPDAVALWNIALVRLARFRTSIGR